MDEDFWSVSRIIFSEVLPVETVTKSWNAVSNKDWNVFFRVLSLVGFVIQVLSGFLIAIIIILRNVVNAPNIWIFVPRLVGQSTAIGIALLITVGLISKPIDELTGQKEIQTDLDDKSALWLYFTGVIWSGLALFWRYSIYKIDYSIDRNGINELLGGLIGLVLADGVYFGGLMVGFGIIFQVYIIRSSS